MHIRIKLFAVLRERAGVSELNLDIPPATSLAVLRETLARQYPALREALGRSAIAVNQSYARDDVALANDDEVALIPPVSGG